MEGRFSDSIRINHVCVEAMHGCPNMVQDSKEAENAARPLHLSEVEDSQDFDSFDDYELKEIIFPQFQKQETQEHGSSEHGLLDGMRYDIQTPPIQTCLKEIDMLQRISSELQDIVANSAKPMSLPLASIELLNHYRSGQKRLRRKMTREKIDGSNERPNLSTEEIMKIAGAKFIQSSMKADSDLLFPIRSLDDYFSELPEESLRNVQLVEILLSAAEKVGNREFDQAGEWLDHCDMLSSDTGNPVERIGYYFSAALRDKIDSETNGDTKGIWEEEMKVGLDGLIARNKSSVVATHGRLPFAQIQQFCAIQTILENITNSKIVHVVDFGLWCGVHWVVLMQALASRQDCPLELLKVTAVGTSSAEEILETGKRLKLFANALELPFSFNVIMLANMIDLSPDLFDIDDGESVVVYAQFLLTTMIRQQKLLDTVMAVIKGIHPRIMVVSEVDSNLNSPDFFNRFTEALFFYGAYFDCFDECMERDEKNRIMAEKVFFGRAITSIIAAEGEERVVRHAKIDVWRVFFNRFGMAEVNLSTISLCQADLVRRNFQCASSCTLGMNGKCLIIGWKGTPIFSVSAWKFP